MGRNDRLEREVAALGDLLHDEVAALWPKAHGCRPPKAIKRALLERSAAWHVQAKALGGLSPATRKAIKAAISRLDGRKAGKQEIDIASRGSVFIEASGGLVGDQLAAKARPANEPLAPPQRSPLQTGTRLLREWNGRQHFVEVVADGFIFNGETYRSLSAIARRITGAHWSGPRFFGL